MNSNEDFKFKAGDLVHVVNFREQYSTCYEITGELLGEVYNEPFYAHPICIGGSLGHRGHKEGEEVFKVISCDYLTPLKVSKVYLLISEEELRRYEEKDLEERNRYPFPVYTVDEDGLEKVAQKVFLVGFYPKTTKAGVRIVDSWPSLEAYVNTRNTVEIGDVKENFFNNSPIAYRLLVAVSALDTDEATKKGAELIKEYLVDKVNRLCKERTEAERMLGRLNEKMEEER